MTLCGVFCFFIPHCQLVTWHAHYIMFHLTLMYDDIVHLWKLGDDRWCWLTAGSINALMKRCYFTRQHTPPPAVPAQPPHHLAQWRRKSTKTSTAVTHTGIHTSTKCGDYSCSRTDPAYLKTSHNTRVASRCQWNYNLYYAYTLPVLACISGWSVPLRVQLRSFAVRGVKREY